MSTGHAAPGANQEMTGNFRVELDGIQCTAFEKATADGKEWNTMPGRLGTDPPVDVNNTGTMKAPVITLSKSQREGGWEDLLEMDTWFNAGSGDRRTGAIVQLDRSGLEVGRLTFKGGFVKKATFPQWDANEGASGPEHTYEIEVMEFNREAA